MPPEIAYDNLPLVSCWGVLAWAPIQSSTRRRQGCLVLWALCHSCPSLVGWRFRVSILLCPDIGWYIFTGFVVL